MNILTESVSAENVCLSVYSSSNIFESLNIAITRDVNCNTGTQIGFSSTESTNEYDSLLKTALSNHISSLLKQLINKVL